MKRNDLILTISSCVTIFLFTVHVSDDIVRGLEPRGLSNLSGIAIMATWLLATLLLMGRRLGYVAILLGSLLCCLFPVAHLRGAGVTAIVATPGGYFFVWGLMTVGVMAVVTAVVAVVCLWGTRKSGSTPLA